MENVKLYQFLLSFRVNGEVITGTFDGLNLRYAKEKLFFQFPNATDIMDWTYEQKEDFERYMEKNKNNAIHLNNAV